MVLLATVGGVIFFNSLDNSAERAVDVTKSPLVETVIIKEFKGDLDIYVDGQVVPLREVNVVTEVGGRVEKRELYCRAGNYVTAGMPLFKIDDKEYQLEVQRLTAEVAKVTANVEEIDVQIANTDKIYALKKEEWELAEAERKRRERLRGTLADTEVDAARRDELMARNAYVQLENQKDQLLKSKKAMLQSKELVLVQLERANMDERRTVITAPIDGVILQEFIEEDDYVQKGTKLITIIDHSAVEIKCKLRMEEMQWLWRQDLSTLEDPSLDIGQNDQSQSENGRQTNVTRRQDYLFPKTPVTVQYRIDDREYQWAGQLIRFDGSGLDEQTRTFPCRVRVTDPNAVKVLNLNTNTYEANIDGPPTLMRGMFVKMSIHSQPVVPLLEIPAETISPDSRIWVVGISDPKVDSSQGKGLPQNGGGSDFQGDNKLEADNSVVKGGGENFSPKTVIRSEKVRIAQSYGERVVIHAEVGIFKAGDLLVRSPISTFQNEMEVRLKGNRPPQLAQKGSSQSNHPSLDPALSEKPGGRGS